MPVLNLLWVLDKLDEIESDLSVFHRVDSLEEISFARFAKLVPLLGHYRGAIRDHLTNEAMEEDFPTSTKEQDMIQEYTHKVKTKEASYLHDRLGAP